MPRPPYWRRQDRRFLLGDVPTDQAIVQQLIPQTSGTKGFDQTAVSWTLSAIRAGRLPAYTEERCAQVKPLDKKTLITNLSGNVTGGLATASSSAAAAGSTTWFAAAAPAFIIGAVALAVVGAIFAHHAQAVAKEQTTMCAAVPAANEALAWVDSEFSAGRLSKADAQASLDSMLQNFTQYVTPVMKREGTSKCNLACGYTRALEGIVAKKKAQIAEAPDPVFASLLSGDGWKGLLPWALGALVLAKAA